MLRRFSAAAVLEGNSGFEVVLEPSHEMVSVQYVGILAGDLHRSAIDFVLV